MQPASGNKPGPRPLDVCRGLHRDAFRAEASRVVALITPEQQRVLARARSVPETHHDIGALKVKAPSKSQGGAAMDQGGAAMEQAGTGWILPWQEARWFIEGGVPVATDERPPLITLAAQIARSAPVRADNPWVGTTPSGRTPFVLWPDDEGTVWCTIPGRQGGIRARFSFRLNEPSSPHEAPFKELQWRKELSIQLGETPVVREHERAIREAVRQLDAEAAKRLVRHGERLGDVVEIWSGSVGPTMGEVVVRVWPDPTDPNRHAPAVVFSARRGKPPWGETPDRWYVEKVRVPPDPGEHGGDPLPVLLERRIGTRMFNLLEGEGVKTVLDSVCLPHGWWVQGFGPEMKKALGRHLAGLGIDPKGLSAILGIDSRDLARSDSEEPAD